MNEISQEAMDNVVRNQIMGTADQLSAVVSQLMGMPVQMSFREYGKNGLTVESQPLPLTSPMLTMLFEQLTVGSFGACWMPSWDDREYVAAFRLNFSYRHRVGGSNGIDAGYDSGRAINLELIRTGTRLEWVLA
jgi:hypothetical protein